MIPPWAGFPELAEVEAGEPDDPQAAIASATTTAAGAAAHRKILESGGTGTPLQSRLSTIDQ
jgi:hypothetical protein